MFTTMSTEQRRMICPVVNGMAVACGAIAFNRLNASLLRLDAHGTTIRNVVLLELTFCGAVLDVGSNWSIHRWGSDRFHFMVRLSSLMFVASCASLLGRSAVAVGSVGVALTTWRWVNRPTAAKVMEAIDKQEFGAWVKWEPLLERLYQNPRLLERVACALFTSSQRACNATPFDVAEFVAALNRTQDHSALPPDIAEGVEKWGPVIEAGRADLALPWILSQGFEFDESRENLHTWTFRNAQFPEDAQERKAHVRQLLTPPPPDLERAPIGARERRNWHRQAAPLLKREDPREQVVMKSNDPALFFEPREHRFWLAAPCAKIAPTLTTPALVDLAHALLSKGSGQPKEVGRVFEELNGRLGPVSSGWGFLWNRVAQYLAWSDDSLDLVRFMGVSRECRDAGRPHLARRHARLSGKTTLKSFVRPDKLLKAAQNEGYLSLEEWRRLGFHFHKVEHLIGLAAKQSIERAACLVGGFVDSHEVTLDELDFGEMDRAALGAEIVRRQAMWRAHGLLVHTPDFAVRMAIEKGDSRSASALALALFSATIDPYVIEEHRDALFALWNLHFEDAGGVLTAISQSRYNYLRPIPPDFAARVIASAPPRHFLDAMLGIGAATITGAYALEEDSWRLGEQLAPLFKALIARNSEWVGAGFRVGNWLPPEFNPADPAAFIEGLSTQSERADVEDFVRQVTHPDSPLWAHLT
jgi:hypothetical protein